MRARLRDAADAGWLSRLDAHTLHDFAVVFRLSTAQHLHLKDVILAAKAGDGGLS